MPSKTEAPRWCSDAKLTTKGWVSPKGELVVSMKVSREQVAAWEAAKFGQQADIKADTKPAPVAKAPRKTKRKTTKKAVKRSAKTTAKRTPTKRNPKTKTIADTIPSVPDQSE